MNDSEERDLQRRVRQRAQKLWEEAGRPAAGSEAYLDQASELVAIEDNQGGAMRPLRPSERAAPEDEVTLAPDQVGPSGEPVEQPEAVANTGEFPTLTDQGEQVAVPKRRGRRVTKGR
jgi:hypothetical protein